MTRETQETRAFDQAVEDLTALRTGSGADVRELAAELAYLRWFYASADFGPAHGDVLYILVREYKQKGGTLPAGYYDPDRDPEEDE